MGMLTKGVNTVLKGGRSVAGQLTPLANKGISAVSPYAYRAAGAVERGSRAGMNAVANSSVARRAAIGGTAGAITGAATGTGDQGQSQTTVGQKLMRGAVGGVLGAGAGVGVGAAAKALQKTAFWVGFEKAAGSLSTSRVDRFLSKLEKTKDRGMLSDVHRRVFANDTLKRQRLAPLKNRASERAAAVQAKGGFKGTSV